MKSTTLLALAMAITSTSAYWKGFNLAATNKNNQCKSQADWEQDFHLMAKLPGHFNSARLYASSDCNTLANAVPAAVKTGTKLLVGVWAEDDTHFEAEKQALLEAIQQHGHDWIVAVSVGSEDLYRGDTTASKLATQIYDVRGMIGSLGAGHKKVGHVDTWTAWVDGANAAVIEAVDFLGMDGYPYFQNVSIHNGHAKNAFWESMHATRAVAQGKKVWLTETGWPVSGSDMGPAVPSVKNAHTYWKEVACQLFKE